MRGATLRQLRAFSLVARHGSFARAADESHLSPSAVSLQIKDLEEAVGLPLFGRHGRVVSLTEAGEILLADVQRVLHALQHADDLLARLRAPTGGTVAVGMVSNAKYFLPRLLAEFRRAHPEVTLQLSVGNREKLLEQLRSGTIDLAVMGEPPDDLEARAEAFADQPLGIVASPSHPLATKRAIPVSALARQEFIVRERGSGTRAAMERFFVHAGIAPAHAMEMTSNGAIKQAVMAQMGLAFLSLYAAAQELQARSLVALDVAGLPLMRRWFVVDRTDAPPDGAACAMRRFIVEHGVGASARVVESPRISALDAEGLVWVGGSDCL